MTVSLSENSEITCLQAPHGLIGSGVPPVTTSSLIFFIPSVTAVGITFLSAHIPNPYEAFSTFTPLNFLPCSSISNAATGNLEYGTYAFLSISFASSI